MGAGHLRYQFRCVKPEVLTVHRVPVRVEPAEIFRDIEILLQIRRRHVIAADQPRLGPGLHRHIGQAHALVHVQRVNGLSAVFHGLIGGAGMADLLDRLQGNILRHHTVPQGSVPADADAFRNFQPDFPGSQHAGHLRGTDAGAETAEGAVGGAVGIGPHHQRARQHMAFVHHHLMAGARELVIVADAVGRRPVPGIFHDVGLFDVSRRCIMVGNDDHLLRVPDRNAHLFQIVGDFHPGPQQIVHHGAIHFRPDDLAGLHAFPAGSVCQDFFADCHAHGLIPPLQEVFIVFYPVSRETSLIQNLNEPVHNLFVAASYSLLS